MTRLNFLKILKSDKLFFTSDNHFFHSNIINFCKRPFANVEEMNETMITLWNEVIPEDGIVIIAGDFCFGNKTKWESVLKRLNGEKHLVLGNHDLQNKKSMIACKDYFKSISHQLYISVSNNQDIIVNHCPFLMWSGMEKGTINLFGHIHTRTTKRYEHHELQYDIGVDNNAYKPISHKEVVDKINEQKEKIMADKLISSTISDLHSGDL